MNRKFSYGFVLGVIVAALAMTGISTLAQMKRTYRDGSVWQISLIRMKPGMESAYLTYIAGDWKKEQDAMKKEGLALSYKVLTTESHGATDWNIALMTEYKNMATLEANTDKAEAVAVNMFGDEQKIRQGYEDRTKIREIIGERLAREIVLEPKP
jgi:hypothetical protein